MAKAWHVVVVAFLLAAAWWWTRHRVRCDVAYLDANATTPMLDVARTAYIDATALYCNPASSYKMGRVANAMLESARSRIARAVGALRGTLVFTSGGSEGNNMVMRAYMEKGRLLVSAGEHASIARVDPSADRIPLTRAGKCDIAALGRALSTQRYALVCVMLANNETGAINDVAAIAKLCAKMGVALHVDAVQAVGKIPVDFDGLGATTYTLSAHKFGGPRGFGAVYMRTPIDALIRGGKQEGQLRAGTSNVAGAHSTAVALEAYMAASASAAPTMREQRAWVVQSLKSAGAKVIGGGLPQTVCACFPGRNSRDALKQLDERKVMVNVGSACSLGGRSEVLVAMGVPASWERGAIRVSWGPFTPWCQIRRGVSEIVALMS
jgi:cysteine desulfurase